MRSITLVCALVLTAPCAAAAAQEADVRAAMDATLAAWNAGDLEQVGSSYSAAARGFFLDGGVMLRGFNLAALQAAHAAGFRASFTARDVDVHVTGTVAVAIAYLDGSLTLPGGEVRQGTWRYTETRVHEAGRWLIVQYHFSQLTIPGGR